ncbi:MAG: dimethyladenosine transferase, rRNA (adenine1518-N6/adenine1519-N6)-dimethyltransferase [Candidatus Parcubacteria bacterium]|jgi:16S rRNA (adenine1518-N6/adenine1519-N6)-dimethyltransferase
MKLFAKKSLGQHFLNSKHVLEQIIAAAEIKKDETVLEIGPGTGFLTRALVDAGAKVVAVEKDHRAIAMLEQDFFADIKENRLEIIAGDILDDSTMDSQFIIHNSQFLIVANIPYYITGAILEKFLEHGPRPSRMILLVQKEVAEKIVAHDKKESILSVSVKTFGTPKIIAKVSPVAFTPPPTVDSAILSITNISDSVFSQKNVDIQGFFRIVKAGFAHKRKFAMRNLETIFSKEKVENIWKKIGLDPKIRAEDMIVEEWVAIAGY